MDDFTVKLNCFLIETFNGILKLEEEIIRHNNDIPLSISELHLIDAIGNCHIDKNGIGDISALLSITLSSVTIGVNKLVKKGFVKKEKDKKDARSVHITLTEQGQKMYDCHQFFHMKMIEHISCELTEGEKEALMKGMERLHRFFSRKQ